MHGAERVKVLLIWIILLKVQSFSNVSESLEEHYKSQEHDKVNSFMTEAVII